MFNPHEQHPKINKGHANKNLNLVPQDQSSAVQPSLSKNFQGNKFFKPLCCSIKTTSTHEIDTNNGKKIVSSNSEVFEDERTLTKNQEVKNLKKKKIKTDTVNWQSQNEREKKNEEQLKKYKKEKAHTGGSDFQQDDNEESLTQTILQCQKQQQQKFIIRQSQLQKQTLQSSKQFSKQKQQQILQQQKLIEKETEREWEREREKEKERENKKVRSKVTLEHNLTYDSQNNPQSLLIALRLEINKAGETQQVVFTTKIKAISISLCLGLMFDYSLLQIQKALINGQHKVYFSLLNERQTVQIWFTKNDDNIKLEFGDHKTAPLIAILNLKKQSSKTTSNNLEKSENIPNLRKYDVIQTRNKLPDNPKMKTDLMSENSNTILIDEEQSDSSEQVFEVRSKKGQTSDQLKLRQLSRAQESEQKFNKLQSQIKCLENQMNQIKDYKQNERQRIKQALQVAIRQKEQQRRIIREQQKKQREEKVAKQKGQKKLEAQKFESQLKKSEKILENCELLLKKVRDIQANTFNKSNQIISRENDKLPAVNQRLSIVQSDLAEIKKWSQEVERYLTLDLKNQINSIYNEFQRRTFDRNERMSRKSPMVRHQYPHYQNNNYHSYQQPKQNIYQNLEKQIRVRGVEDWQKQNEKQKQRQKERQREIQKEKRLKQVQKDTYSSYNSYQNFNNYGVAKTQFCDNLAEAENIVIRDLRILEGKSFKQFEKKCDNSDEDNISEEEIIRKARINQRNQYRKFGVDDDEDFGRSRSRSVNPIGTKDKAREIKQKRIEEQKRQEELQIQKQKQIYKQKKRQIERQKEKQRLEQAAQQREMEKQRQRKIELEREKRFGRSPQFKRDSYSPAQTRKYRKQSQQQDKVKIVWHLFPSTALEFPQTNIPVMVHKNFKGFDINGQKIKYSNAKNDWGQIIGGQIAYQNLKDDATVQFKVLKTKYINANFGIGIVNDIPPQNAPKVRNLNADGEKKFFEHAIIYNSGNCQLWKIERTNKQICVTKGTGLKVGDILKMVVNLEKGEIIWMINKTEVGRISHKIMMNRKYEWKRFLLMKNDEDEIEMV